VETCHIRKTLYVCDWRKLTNNLHFPFVRIFCTDFSDGILRLFDLYIFKMVYESHEKAKSDTSQIVEPSKGQRGVQLAEAVLESLPQTILQLVFVLKAFNNPTLKFSKFSLRLENDVSLFTQGMNIFLPK